MNIFHYYPLEPFIEHKLVSFFSVMQGSTTELIGIEEKREKYLMNTKKKKKINVESDPRPFIFMNTPTKLDISMSRFRRAREKAARSNWSKECASLGRNRQ